VKDLAVSRRDIILHHTRDRVRRKPFYAVRILARQKCRVITLHGVKVRTSARARVARAYVREVERLERLGMITIAGRPLGRAGDGYCAKPGVRFPCGGQE